MQRRVMNDFSNPMKIHELEQSIRMHQDVQRRCDPVAHPEYWIRALYIGACEERKLQLQTGLRYRYFKEKVEAALRRLETLLQGTTDFEDDLSQITNAVLEKASAEWSRSKPPFTHDELERMLHDFADMHRKNNYDPRFEDSLAWCPVLGTYLAPTEVLTTHIFPFWMHDQVVKMIFGSNVDCDLMSLANGLVLDQAVAFAFTNLWIVIVPAGPPESGRWKTRVIRQDLLTRYVGAHEQKWSSIDNKELTFLGPSRPSARFLYWHYATARIQASAGQIAGWWTLLMDKDCWQPAERYIRVDYLEAYMERCQDFDVTKFNDLRIRAIQVRSDDDLLDVRIAAKMMRDDMEHQHELVYFPDAEAPEVDEDDGSSGYLGGHGGKLVSHARPTAEPARILGAEKLSSSPGQKRSHEEATGDANPLDVVLTTGTEVQSPRLVSDVYQESGPG